MFYDIYSVCHNRLKISPYKNHYAAEQQAEGVLLGQDWPNTSVSIIDLLQQSTTKGECIS